MEESHTENCAPVGLAGTQSISKSLSPAIPVAHVPEAGEKAWNPAEVINGRKTFTVLENNPIVMNSLAYEFGLDHDLKFYDVWSFEADAIVHIPRPVIALLVILPLTEAWGRSRQHEDEESPSTYDGHGAGEPIIWIRQTIGHACGSIGLLHCLINGEATSMLKLDGFAARFREAGKVLTIEARANLLYNSQEFERKHQMVAEDGDTKAPSAAAGDRLGQHFVSFVKQNGKLWELEGSRKGPINRGEISGDVLSEEAIAKGIGRIMQLDGNNDIRVSCIALAPALDPLEPNRMVLNDSG